ncbi:MAG: DUF1207 domain-containing protein [Planctomycetaceae bacterium]|nr:DUF1207 domain-containing protein [Planctomycetaceae bacterium]
MICQSSQGMLCAEDDWVSVRDLGLAAPAYIPQSTGLRLLAEDAGGEPWVAPITQSAAEDEPPLLQPVEPAVLDLVPLDLENIEPAQFGAPPANYYGARPEGWQLLPQGHLYGAYLAGEKESRMAAQWLWDRDRGLVWETALGGRWGIVRNGTYGSDNPQGFQLDMEGAGLARVDPEEKQDLEAVDFRAGIIGTWRDGPWRFKTGYYHLSSHAGDEFLLKNPGFVRINYVRDALLVGGMYDINPDLQVYAEMAVALNHNGGAEPFEFQFGAQYSPAISNGIHGAPFAAINGHLRQEFNFGGSVNIMAGWQWRGMRDTDLFRAGFQHYNGASMQWELFDRYESMTGMSIWYDY